MAGAHALRQADPEVEATLGIVPADAGARELALQRGATALLFPLVHLAQLRDMRGRAAAALELEHDALPERSGRRVHRLLRRGHATDRVAVRDDPADAQ